MMRPALVAAILVLTTATLCAQQPNLQQLVQQVGLDQHLDRQVPLDLEFLDEDGRPVQLKEYFRDKPVVLNLVYFRCPMLCTQVLNGFLKSSQAVKLQIGADYEVISVSIDPQETPEMAAAKKARYAGSYRRPGAQKGWHFLTGKQAAIERLARTVGYRYHYDPKTGQYAHPSGLIVLTPQGRISRYFYGIDYHPTDLRLGLVESSQGKIGNLADQVLLLCFHYDPATGKYGLIIAGALRLAGFATVVILGTFLVLMFRREIRRSTAMRRRATALSASGQARAGGTL